MQHNFRAWTASPESWNSTEMRKTFFSHNCENLTHALRWRSRDCAEVSLSPWWSFVLFSSFVFFCSSLDGGKAHQVDENLCTVDILISAALQLTDVAKRASVKLFLSQPGPQPSCWRTSLSLTRSSFNDELQQVKCKAHTRKLILMYFFYDFYFSFIFPTSRWTPQRPQHEILHIILLLSTLARGENMKFNGTLAPVFAHFTSIGCSRSPICWRDQTLGWCSSRAYASTVPSGGPHRRWLDLCRKLMRERWKVLRQISTKIQCSSTHRKRPKSTRCRRRSTTQWVQRQCASWTRQLDTSSQRMSDRMWRDRGLSSLAPTTSSSRPSPFLSRPAKCNRLVSYLAHSQ